MILVGYQMKLLKSPLLILSHSYLIFTWSYSAERFAHLFSTYKDIETITENLVASESVLKHTPKKLVLKIEMKGEKLDRYLFYKKTGDQYAFTGDRVTAYPQAFYILLYQLSSNENSLDKKKRQLLSWMKLCDMKDKPLQELFHINSDIFQQLASLSESVETEFDIHVNKIIDEQTSGEKDNNSRLFQIYLEHLGLRRAFWQSKTKCLDLEIGGMSRHRLGYMFCHDQTSLPEISRSDFYYVSRLSPGWIFYRRLLNE